jgi:type II secretory pathway pseudopilin PulG
LVVIIILTTVVAAAIPILAPSDNDRRLREATRTLNTVITSAQAKAIQLRRPYGIALKRLSWDTKADDDNGACVEVFFAEQLPPFTGFSETSAATVALDNGPNGGGAPQVLIRFVARGTQPNNDRLPIGWDPDPLPPSTFRPGDVVEIAGTQFRFTDTDVDPDNKPYYGPNSGEPDGTLVAVPVNDTGQMLSVRYDDAGYELSSRPANTNLPLPCWTSPAPYKILRQPTLTSTEPFQMPDGTAIDLRASGIGANEYFYVPGIYDNNAYVYIMFAPEGRVSRVQFDRRRRAIDDVDLFDAPIVDNLFLLVGNVENIPAPAVGSDPTLDASMYARAATDEERQELKEPVNWLSGESRWVVLGPQSGRVVTVENAAVDPQAIIGKYTSSPYSLAAASEPLRNEQIKAAREFTRGMAQLGGR